MVSLVYKIEDKI